MRILIAEDDLSIRILLQSYISHLGNCNFAVDGLKAFEAFNLAWREGQPYDLILLDLRMPEMNGQEVLESIRKREKELGIACADCAKVIIITAMVDSENLQGAFMAGCEAFIAKPIEKKKLLNQIKELGLIKE